jgi:murein endopeptidase
MMRPSIIADGAVAHSPRQYTGSSVTLPSGAVVPMATPSRAAARAAAGRLASFGATELEDVAARRFAANVMIEGDDAVHLGARQIQRLRHHHDRSLGHAAERFLQRLQDRQQRAVLASMLRNDLARAFQAPPFVSGHLVCLISKRLRLKLAAQAQTGEIIFVDQYVRQNDAIG